MNSIPTAAILINEPAVLEIIPFLTQLVAASRKNQTARTSIPVQIHIADLRGKQFR